VDQGALRDSLFYLRRTEEFFRLLLPITFSSFSLDKGIAELAEMD